MASVLVRLWLGMAALMVGCAAWAQNVIQQENAKPGHADWALTALADNPTVEGYASLVSVPRGGTIGFHVSSAVPTYTMAIYRMGWYGGAGARKMHSVTLPGTRHPVPTPDPATGLVDANWPEAYRLTIPNTADKTDWATGVYLAKLVPSTGSESYIMFVVRDDTSAAPFTFQSAVTTHQAYNNWGGKSLYSYNSGGAPARKVSFNRPYKRQAWADAGTGKFLNWEIYMLRFLEREGYDVSYITNLDVHAEPARLQRHKALLIAGHDEYWTYQMRQAVQSAQDQGVHIGFFSANQTYWQIRLEAAASGAPHRTVVAYKEAAQSQDPLALDADAANDRYITARFRDLKPVFGVNDPIAQPENALVGVMYHGDPFDGDIVVASPGSWVFAGTGAVAGTRFRGLLGYETDAVFDNGFSPSGLQKLADSPDTWGGSQVTTYTAASGAIVFATGSMQWNWGLDNYGWRNLEDAGVKQVTRNVLNRFAQGTLAAPGNLRATGGAQRVDLAWSAVSGASSYNVYRGTGTTPGTTPHRTGLATPALADTGLPAGTYSYQVTALSGGLESARSGVVTAAASGTTTACVYPAWVQGQAYAAGDIVTYQQALYRAKHANPGYNPTISTYYWEPFTCPYGPPPPPPPPCTYPQWVMGRSYAAGDIVTYEGALYRAKHANPGYNPTISTYYWAPHTCQP